MHTRGREGGRFPFEIPEQRCAQRARTNRFASLQRSHAFHHVLRRSLSRQVPVNSRPHALQKLSFLSRHTNQKNSHLGSGRPYPSNRGQMSVSSPSRSSVRKGSAVNNPPPPLSRFGTRPDFQPQFGTTFSLLLLYQRFTPLFPHSLPSFSGTSVLPFSWNVLLPSGTFPL